VEESGPLAKHFFQQIRIPVRIRTFDNDDHSPTPL